MKLRTKSWSLVLMAGLLLAACGGGGKHGSTATTAAASGTGSAGGGSASGRSFKIAPGENATRDMLVAMVQARPGDVIEFDCGFFDITSTLLISQTEDILIKGCGRDKTVLSFRTNNAPEGILAVGVRGLVIQDLTVADTDGNGIELRGVDHATIRRVRTFWSTNGGRESPTPINKDNFRTVMDVKCTDPATQNPAIPENAAGDITSPDYTVSDKAGRYGVYPVSSDNVLIDETESIGASDAGIYVGQTNNAIIRNSRAAYNVFGFEIENVQGGEYHDNIAECNTGGFLVYDLDGNLRQYGDRTRMYRNISRKNNTYNFTEGGFVANVPPGSGMITLSYDRIDIFENEFSDNNTGGILHVSYELFPEGAGRPTEKRIDYYTEGVHIYKNKFKNNGNSLPAATTADLANQDVARLLPAIVGLKNQAAGDRYRGAHIVWDGLLDTLDAGCAYPKKPDGTDVPRDSRGKPQHTNQEDPTCHYNAYKFRADGRRILPDWWASCIDDDNEYSSDSLKFSNFRGTKGANAAIAVASGGIPTPAQLLELQEFPALFDLTPHQCVKTYGRNMDPLPPIVIPPFVRSGDVDPAPSPEQVTSLCQASVGAGEVNFAAGKVNCPTLDQYNLFSDPQDPTSAANGGGVPFVLNTKLFSDYTVKYRVLYMPPGTKATYKDASTGGAFPENATILYPVGTIIAKTFSFADVSAGTEMPAETRLLIKRSNARGDRFRWDGLPYIWTTEGGRRVAKLSMVGGSMSASWNTRDVDSGQTHVGSTTYIIPNANQCLSCHSREDSEVGSAPIGTKARNLNRPFRPESDFLTGQGAHESRGKNQLAYLCEKGLMNNCPADMGVDPTSQIATRVERLPIFNKPGDSGAAPGSDPDIEARARAWLEVNCQHCHNVRGFAASSGLYLNASGPVGLAHGICKRPTAAGAEGSGGRLVDIHPANPARSILEFRISPAATSAAARMPPIARSVVDVQGHALVEQWIRDVIEVNTTKYPNSNACPQ